MSSAHPSTVFAENNLDSIMMRQDIAQGYSAAECRTTANLYNGQGLRTWKSRDCASGLIRISV